MHAARVLLHSLPSGNFSELTVAVDAESDGGAAVQLQASRVPARCFTYSSIKAEIASDAERVHLHSKDIFTAARNVKTMSAYIDIPESNAVAKVLVSCWAGRQRAAFGILLHGPSGSGKTACVRHILSENMIRHEFFDCAAMYERDGSSFTAAVRSVAQQTKRNSALASDDCGAVLVLDRLECMFPPLSPHTQVFKL